MTPRVACCLATALLASCASVPASERTAGTPPSDRPARPGSSPGGDSATLVRVVTVNPELLDMLHVRVTDAAGTRSFDGGDFSTTTVDGPGSDPEVAPFPVRSPGTVVVDVALLTREPTDTLAAMTFTEPVYGSHTHFVVIQLGGRRPFGMMESDIHAAVLRRALPGYPHDTVFVSWRFFSRTSS